MLLSRQTWTAPTGWTRHPGSLPEGDAAHLVLVFGAPSPLRNEELLADLRAAWPGAYICGCSTAGEIDGDRVLDDSLTATAIRFERSWIRVSEVTLGAPEESFSAGQELAMAIPHEGLVHAFVLSDGLAVNGSELVKGLTSQMPAGAVVTGGLSGDGDRFAATYVCAGGVVARNRIVLVGFYGPHLRVGYGSMGGWDPFGPERRITRSRGNVLFELDHRSALELYKSYLGSHAAELPASALRFPLTLRYGTSESVVRTILAVNEGDQSMTFAGDMPEGALVRLMHANFDRLIDGANGAARACQQRLGSGDRQLAILISCVGRKLILKQRVEEEVESVLEVLGADTTTTGFYSYGEISPFAAEARCALHNQTMTITTLREL
jgi:hypothetical protein